jgi:hypothetical protein
MERKVTFREFCGPFIDDETGEEHRGEYWGSFTRTIEGDNLLEIISKAEKIADEKSKPDDNGEEILCQVWEVPV